MENKEKNTPEKTIPVGGGVRASVWKNESTNGAYFTVNISRTYKNADGEFKNTTAFRRDELLFVADAARRAYNYLLNTGGGQN